MNLKSQIIMKKIVIILAFSLGLTNLHAQTENTSNDYNKWSVELDGGFNKPHSLNSEKHQRIAPYANHPSSHDERVLTLRLFFFQNLMNE